MGEDSKLILLAKCFDVTSDKFAEVFKEDDDKMNKKDINQALKQKPLVSYLIFAMPSYLVESLDFAKLSPNSSLNKCILEDD